MKWRFQACLPTIAYQILIHELYFECLNNKEIEKKYDLEFIGLFEFELLKIVAVRFILQEEEPELASCKTKSFHMICRLDFIQRHRIEN